MSRSAIAVLAFLLLAASPVGAQDAASNALRDAARAQGRQARSLERLEVIQRDEARRAAQDLQNAERDARSLRRFDRR